MILAQLGGIFCTIFVLGGSILAHELGHYWTARRLRFQIPRFSIGFGPRLFSWTHNGTEFCLSAIPLGGYVSLPQMEFGPSSPSLRCASCWERCAIAAMGPLANLVLALALAIILWILGRPVLPGELDCTVGAFSPALAEFWKLRPDVTLREGDRILAVDGTPLNRLSDLVLRVALGTAVDGEGQPVARLRFERDGQAHDLVVPVLRHISHGNSAQPLRSLPLFPAQPTVVRAVFAHSPAELVGLLPGDEIITCGDNTVHSPIQLQQIVEKHSGDGPISLTLRRNEALQTLQILPVSAVTTEGYLRAQKGKKIAVFLPGKESGTWRPVIGDEKSSRTREELKRAFTTVEEISPQIRSTLGVVLTPVVVLKHTNPFRAVGHCVGETAHTLLALFSPRSDVGVRHLTGVADMVRTLHRLSLDDFRSLLHFAVVINVGLALLNLLPIPALDGGQICFALLGKIFGSPLPNCLINWLHNGSLLLLFAMLAYVTALDLLRWRSESRLKTLQRDLTALQRPPQF